MKQIIRSALLTKDVSFIASTMQDIQDRVPFITLEERGILAKLYSILSSGVEIPDPSFFDLPVSKVISRNDVPAAISVLSVDRLKIKQAQDLVAISQKVQQEGMSDDVRKMMSNMDMSRTTEVEVVDNFANVEGMLDDQAAIVNDACRTYIPEVDQKIGSFLKGYMTTIAAFVGNFKSMSALNMFYNAVMNGANCMFVSLEVVERDLWWNLLSLHTYKMNHPQFPEISHSDIKKNKITVEEREHLLKVVLPDFKSKVKGAFYLIDSSFLPDTDEAGFTKMFKTYNEHSIATIGKPIDMVVIDYLQLCAFFGDSRLSEREAANKWSNYFVTQSKDFGGTGHTVAMVTLAQVNRDGYRRAIKNDGLYDLMALSDANKIERDSALIMFIFADEKLKVINQAKLTVLKNRNGQVIVDPVVVEVSPENYVFGKQSTAFTQSLGVDDISDIFSTGLGDISLSLDIDLGKE